MTVNQLIGELFKMDQDAEVKVYWEEDLDVEDVYTDEDGLVIIGVWDNNHEGL